MRAVDCLPMKTNDLRCQGRNRTAVQGFADPYLASRPLDLINGKPEFY
jgi:hypothetical protein